MNYNDALEQARNHYYLIGEYIGDYEITHLVATPIDQRGQVETIRQYLDTDEDSYAEYETLLHSQRRQFHVVVVLDLSGDINQITMPLAEVISRLS